MIQKAIGIVLRIKFCASRQFSSSKSPPSLSPVCYLQLKNYYTIMKQTIQLLFLFSASLLLCSCSDNATKSKEPREITQPEFADNGKTVDSLKKVYNCESINFENWGDKKTTDSCLTVCLVNSTKVPSNGNVDSTADQLKGVASSINKSLTKPQTYKSFYIIFVKKENVNGLETKTHSAGMEILSSQL